MTATEVDLWISLDDVHTRALSIPIEKCREFSLNPLKWLRFLGYAIYGREGYISTSEDGSEVGNYESDVEARSYYFVSGGESNFCVLGRLCQLLR
jgi:hypothetical protein